MSGSSEMQMQMQMQMDSDQSAILPSLSPLVRPIGISPSVHETEPGKWHQGNRWPPVSMLKDAQSNKTGKGLTVAGGDEYALSHPPEGEVAKWANHLRQLAQQTETQGSAQTGAEGYNLPGRQWSAQYYAIAVLGEFVEACIAVDEVPNEAKSLLKNACQHLMWNKVRLDPKVLLLGEAAASTAEASEAKRKLVEAVKTELSELVQLMDYRPNVLAEALAQREGIDTYFRGVLSFTQASHPRTFGLMQIALRTGELQSIHYKYQFNRPRASTLAPWLMPPIEVPGHASFPSGHSTQSHLVALVLGEVMPCWARGKYGPLRQLAERIARNREVLGLHYPSDSKAGEKLATASFLLLRRCRTVLAMIRAARAEWGTDGRGDAESTLAELGYD
jgi:hypothetical protein